MPKLMFNLYVQKHFDAFESVLDSDGEGNILTIRSRRNKKYLHSLFLCLIVIPVIKLLCF